MAQALLSPLKDELNSLELYFYTPSINRAKILSTQISQNFMNGEEDSNWNLSFDGVFLAHKPQQLEAVGELLKSKLKTRPKFIISILAAKTITDIQNTIFDVPVLRLMPNTPCLVGRGIITEVSSHNFDFSVRSYFQKLF